MKMTFNLITPALVQKTILKKNDAIRDDKTDFSKRIDIISFCGAHQALIKEKNK